MVGLAVLSCFAGFLIGAACIGTVIARKYRKELINRKHDIEKLQYMVRVYDVWMMVNKEKKTIAGALQEKGIHSIAIYGMSYLGNRLYHELEESGIDVKYGIDMDTTIRLRNLRTISPTEMGDDVDAVVVTALTAFDTVKANLERKGYKNIVSLDEVLYDWL